MARICGTFKYRYYRRAGVKFRRLVCDANDDAIFGIYGDLVDGGDIEAIRCILSTWHLTSDSVIQAINEHGYIGGKHPDYVISAEDYADSYGPPGWMGYYERLYWDDVRRVNRDRQDSWMW